MMSTHRFVRTHRAKLTWKMLKNGARIAFVAEKSEKDTQTPNATEDSEYVEVVFG